MPIVKRSCIEDIKSRVNIHDVVAPYVRLKRSGANWRGLSPFNEEKTPSFYALPEKNIFKCFSTGNAGDIFRFIQLKENLNFNEAIESIAQRFNITLEYEASGKNSGIKQSLRKELFEIHTLAAQYYKDCFHASTRASEEIRDYWTNERQFSLESAKKFEIGYAYPNDRGLIQKLTDKQFSFDAIKQSGLFYARDHDTHPSRLRPRFNGRLMIPIHDVQGRIIAFTARKLKQTPSSDPAAEAKYINSPETPIFIKSQVLFGLDKARQSIQEHDPILLVEGQLDVIRCHETGITTAVAPQGTAITDAQLSLVRRYTGCIQCLLDGDSAGQKAALRLLPLSLAHSIEVAFLPLPVDSDPDTYLLKHGIPGLDQLISKSITPMAFAVDCLMPSQNPTPQQKADTLQSLFELLHHCESTIVQSEYLKELSRLTLIESQVLEKDFKQSLKNKRIKRTPEPVAKKVQDSSQKLITAEYELLLIILHDKELAQAIAQIVHLDWIPGNSMHGKLLARFLCELQEGIRSELEPLDELLETDQEINCIYSLLSDTPPFESPIKSANACIQSLYKSHLDKKRKQIDNAMAQEKDPQKQHTFLRERVALRKASSQAPQLETASV